MQTNRSVARPPERDLVAGYEILEEIRQSSETGIYRARRLKDGVAVVLKALLGEPTAERVARYRNEREVLAAVRGPHVVRCLALEQNGPSPVLVLQDVGGVSLTQYMNGRALPLRQALLYGGQMAEALNEIHAARAVHRDVSPDNIVINREAEALKVIDFGISTMLPHMQQALGSPRVLLGTLAYMAPEQTGRMNRVVDYRADFYSFGATLYEMLTGEPPFSAGDALDLVHLHIAKQPVPPHRIDAGIPTAVSEVVMKLLAKMAEDRYQSARGIRADLDKCLKQLDETGTVAPFDLAREDKPSQFRIPQKLYGRERNIALLLDKFRNVAAGGREIALIGGYSGIGKTSLVREIYKPVTEHRGYFAAGKFDQLQRSTPFKGVIEALSGLIKQLLSEDEKRLAGWRGRLLEELGTNAQVIAHVIPDVALIIGPQPAVSALGPAETQNRLYLAFRNFIQVFCQAGHPLVLFLDDLQWADSVSLNFLTYLVKDESLRHLMVIGAYRNNEVDEGHPLTISLQRLTQAGVALDDMTLEPLALDAIMQLLCDALYCGAPAARPLAELIAAKTGGNPFFVDAFLKSLDAEGLLSFDPQEGRWRWDIAGIRTRDITDNVVDLMTAKFARLDTDTKRALSLAACLGSRFDLLNLATIYGGSPADVITALRPALHGGFVFPLDAGSGLLMAGGVEKSDAARIECRFPHDRIHEAAYNLIDDGDKPRIHRAIGALLLANTAEADLDNSLFEIVNHLHLGAALIGDDGEREQLARLSLKAALAAKSAGAYDSALRFLKRTLDLWPADRWRSHYALTLGLHVAAVDAASAGAKYRDMETLSRAALAHARDLLDKVDIFEIKILAATRQGQLTQAIALGLEALKSLGLILPARPSTLQVLIRLIRVRWALAGRNPDDLMVAAGTPDPRLAARQRILIAVGLPAYFVNPKLWASINFEVVRLSTRPGLRVTTGLLAAHAMILAGALGRIEEGYRYGEAARRMVDRLDLRREKPSTYFICATFAHLKRPARELLPAYLEAYQRCLEGGHLDYAAGSLFGYCYVSFLAGLELSAVEQDFARYGRTIKRTLENVRYHQLLALGHQAVRNLLGKSEDPCSLSGDMGDEDEIRHALQAAAHNTALFTYYFFKHYLSYFFGRYEDAVRFADASRPLAASVTGFPVIPVLAFSGSLARLALYEHVDRAQQRALLRTVAANQKKLQKWARHAPANYRHKFLLVAAELARVRGEEVEAMDLYEQSIDLARRNQYVQDEALGAELAGRFHLARERKTVGLTYLRQALHTYQRWGAAAKAAALRQSHPQLSAPPDGNTAGAKITRDLSPSGFDLRTLRKALKGIAEEKLPSQVLLKTVLTAIEFAGADAGVLALRARTGDLYVEAAVSLDRKPEILQAVPLADADHVSQAIVNYVRRTKQSVVVNDAQNPDQAVPGLSADPYVKNAKVKSILCIPLMAEGAADAEGLSGLLYLENKQASDTFDQQRIETLEIICLAAAGRLELSRKAATDGLTDLYNRDTFEKLLQKELSVARRNRRQLSLIMADIDHFKKVNDRFGHQAGDVVLQKLAGAVKDSCRLSDIVARYGGEEIAVILPDTDGPQAARIGERIRAQAEALRMSENGSLPNVTISVGVATLAPGTKDTAVLIKRADEALYQSKRSGRNRITIAKA